MTRTQRPVLTPEIAGTTRAGKKRPELTPEIRNAGPILYPFSWQELSPEILNAPMSGDVIGRYLDKTRWSALQNIMEEFFPGVTITNNEMLTLSNLSNFAVKQYLMNNYFDVYAQSQEGRDRIAGITENALLIFGENISSDEMRKLIVSGASATEILNGWRMYSSRYKEIYKYKPLNMTEAKYMELKDKFEVESKTIQSHFLRYGGRELSEEELAKIYYGGENSADIRAEYVRIEGLNKSYQNMLGKQQTTGVNATPFGPVQPLMKGVQSGQSSPTMWNSYADYEQGNLNPNYVDYVNQNNAGTLQGLPALPQRVGKLPNP